MDKLSEDVSSGSTHRHVRRRYIRARNEQQRRGAPRGPARSVRAATCANNVPRRGRAMGP